MDSLKRTPKDSFQQEVNSFCRTVFDQAVAQSSSDSKDIEPAKAETRSRFLAILEHHNQSTIADIQSGRTSIVKAVCDEFPEAGPPPQYLLNLERLFVLDQANCALSEHAEGFRQLASSLPERHRPVALGYFVRSLTDGMSRRILRGILAAMRFSGLVCSVDGIITIAAAIEKEDIGLTGSGKMADTLAADMLYLVDLVKAQKVIIDAQEEQLTRLRAASPDFQADSASETVDKPSPPCPVKVKNASSCCAQ
ncbi:uncharacterized protein BDV14DRAFT_201333 [Aspergillus stella-maris]|uniref:uncharacterized protein n=1 Tax=Aspergillus stella-maris TaxID=1810926 RepID=UPI003CCDE7E7